MVGTTQRCHPSLAEAFGPLDLRPSEVSVLHIIAANEEIKQRQIGKQLGIKRANMTPIMVTLEKRKLIKRAPLDGRSHTVKLTNKGKKVIAQAEGLMELNEAKFVENTDHKTLDTVMTFLRSMRDIP